MDIYFYRCEGMVKYVCEHFVLLVDLTMSNHDTNLVVVFIHIGVEARPKTKFYNIATKVL